MQVAYIWNKLYLHRTKVILTLLLIAFGMAQAQNFLWARKNNPYYDEKRKVSYGFLIGLHTSSYQIKYSDLMVTPALDDLYSVDPVWKPGFSLGFLVNYRALEFLDIRITPNVSFYEHELTYRYVSGTIKQQLIETTMVEFPLLAKYKSMRRGNVRMYMVGGLNPAIEASGKKDIENVTGTLDIANFNLNLEAGFGFDLYFPLFKFSPEIRFSKGLINQLDSFVNEYEKPLKQINTNTITFYMIFQ